MTPLTSEQVLSNLKDLKELRICLFTDFDTRSHMLASYCQMKDIDLLCESALINILSNIDCKFGRIRDEEGVTLAHISAAIMMEEKGYMLYVKHNAHTGKIEIYSVGRDFLDFLVMQHNFFIQSPASLTTPWDDVLDPVSFVYDLDVRHQFARSVRRSETALEVRLNAFDTTISKYAISMEETIRLLRADEKVEITKLDESHVFSAKYLADEIYPSKPGLCKTQCNYNALLLVGHGGVGIIYNYDDKSYYVVNKILTKKLLNNL